MNQDYIIIIQHNSKLKNSGYYPLKLKRRVNEAMKKLELEMTAQEIIENTRIAFQKNK